MKTSLPLVAAFLGTALVTTNFADDDRVALETYPAAVQETVKQHLVGGTLDEIDQIRLEGRTLYKVEIDLPKGERKLYVSGDGTLLKVREDIPLKAAPQAVIDAARQQPGKIDDVERETAGDQTRYFIEYDLDNDDDDEDDADDDVTIEFAADGRIISQR